MSTVLPAQTASSTNNTTLAGLRRFALDYIQGPDDDDLLAVATRSVNAGIDRLNVTDWNWTLSYKDISTETGVFDYWLDNKFRKPFALQFLDTDSNQSFKMPYLAPRDFMTQFPVAADEGNPQVFTVVSRHTFGKLTLNASPSADFVSKYPTMRIRYWAYVPHLTVPTDVLDAPPEFGAFIGWYARYDLATSRGEPGQTIVQAERMWRDMERQLIADDNDFGAESSYVTASAWSTYV